MVSLKKLFRNQSCLAALLYFFLTWSVCFRFLMGDYLPLPFDNYLLIDKEDLSGDGWIVKNRLVSDSSYQMYPWRKMVIEGYKNFQMASFNPNIILGNSLLGNGQSGIFYPGNIFLLTNFNLGWKILFFSQFFLAAFFTFLFIKTLKMSFYSAFLGGLIFGFSGFMAAWDSWTTVGHTILWLPLMLLSLSKWGSSKKIRWLLILVFSIFCSITAGFPQFALYSLITSFSYFLFLGIKNHQSRNFWFLGGISFIWGLGLSLIQILPIISLLSISNRISQFKLVNLTGVPIGHLLTFLAPGFFGWPEDTFYFGTQNFNETANYFGIIAFVLVLVSLLFSKLKELVFWKLLFLISLFLIFNNPISDVLSNVHSLVFGRGLSGRIFFITIFAASILSAKGLENIANINHRTKISIIIISILCLLSLLKVAAVFRYLIFPDSLFVYQLEFIGKELLIPLILLSIFFALLYFRKFLSQRFITLSIVILITLDLFYVLQKVTPWSPANLLFDKQTLQITGQLSDPFAKTVGFISTGENTLFGIPSFEGYDSIYPKSYLSFLKENCGTPTENFTNWVYIDEVNCLPSLQNFGLKYIIDKDDLLMPEIQKRWGKTVEDEYELLQIQENFKIYEYKKYSYPIAFEGSGQVISAVKNNQSYILEINSHSNQKLKLFFNFLDGWQVQLNGHPIVPQKDNNGFINIDVPEGRSQILLKYFPGSLVNGFLFFPFFLISGTILVLLNARICNDPFDL